MHHYCTCIFLFHKKADPTDRILLTIYVKQYIGIKMHCQCAFLRSNSCKNPILPLFLLLCYCHSCTRIPCVYCVWFQFYHNLYRLVSYLFYRYISSYSFLILSGASSHSLPSSSKKRMTPPPLCGWYTIPPPTDLRFEGCFLSIGMWAGMVAIGTDIGTEELAHWCYMCREWNRKISFECILHLIFAYAIMPIGKEIG